MIYNKSELDQDEYNDFILQQDTTNGTPFSGPSGPPRTLEVHALRLAELNIELCKECLMPKDSHVNINRNKPVPKLNPMTKNFASRALGAIGLKARMLRIDFEGRKKSAMILRASAEELRKMGC
ncbi:hypothetical protein RhiirB3_450752 [Rhizophagus irregularis]|nr:hypothetical protein RhiirB3_450752 [Rhizophagus irregularis]